MRNAWRWSRLTLGGAWRGVVEPASRVGKTVERHLLLAGGSVPHVQRSRRSGRVQECSADLERNALDKIGRAIQEATRGLVEARIGAGTGVAYIGHNRLRVKCRWIGELVRA